MAATQDGKQEGSDQNFDYMFKLLIIGNSSVGKTSFLFRYADDAFTSAFVSTVGIDFKVKTVYKNEKRIKLQIWVYLSFLCACLRVFVCVCQTQRALSNQNPSLLRLALFSISQQCFAV